MRWARSVLSATIASGVLLAAVTGGTGRVASAAVSYGRVCEGVVDAFPAKHTTLTLTHEAKWDTDSWYTRPPGQIRPYPEAPSSGGEGRWEARGGAVRGCHTDVRYNTGGHGTLEFTLTKPWNGSASWNCRNLNGGPDCVRDKTQVRNQDNRLYVIWKLQLP